MDEPIRCQDCGRGGEEVAQLEGLAPQGCAGCAEAIGEQGTVAPPGRPLTAEEEERQPWLY